MARLKIKYLPVAYCLLIVSCKHEPFNPLPDGNGNYPDNVAKIMLTKCATTGCHNDASYEGAGGLNLTTWDRLFEGGNSGAVVIPYRPDFSTVCFYTNTDTSLGPTLIPTMPVNNTPLSNDEYLVLRDWIAAGAPDIKGNIKFADNPTRSKLYVTNQLCDVVTVFDTETLLQMRYITTGKKQATEFPRTVKVSPDKKHWYVSFFAPAEVVQKFNTGDDRLVGEIFLGRGSWTSFVITSDSKYGFFADNGYPGRIAYADLENMRLLATYTFNGNFRYPSGIALNEEFKMLYMGNTTGNYIYTIDIADPMNPVVKEMAIDGNNEIQYHSTLDPSELITDATGNCIVACTGSDELKVINMKTNSVIHSVPLAASPFFMDFSPATNKLFITCPHDEQTFSGNSGSVVVVDMNNFTVTKRINSGYQPFGIAVDDSRGIVAIVNANLSPKGNEPHHTSNCGGRNGNVTFIDLQMLELIPNLRSEVAVFPYGAAAR